MKIELKKISYNKRLSQETSAYSAEIWINGVKRGDVMNHGTGGPDLINPPSLYKEINAHAATLPPYKSGTFTCPMDSELLCGELLNRHLLQKDLEKKFKTKVVFSTANGKLYEQKGLVAPQDAVKVLNTMPIEEAIDLYLKSNQ